MNVNRDRFLILVATLAAACGATPSSGIQRPISGAPEVPRDPSEAISTTPDAPTSPPDRPAASEGDDTEVPQGAPASATEGGEPSPYSGTKVVGQSCSPSRNAFGMPHTCASLRAPGPTCESFADTKEECQELSRRLKPRIAAKAIDCLLAKSGKKDICVFNISGICAYQALAAACVDPSSRRPCEGVVASCSGKTWSKMSEESCEAALSAVASPAQPQLIACMTESCSFEGCLTY